MTDAPTPAQSDETRQPDPVFASIIDIIYARLGSDVVVQHRNDVEDLVDDMAELIAAERQRIYAAVEEAITERSKPDDNCSKWAESVYQGHGEAVAELRAAIKRLREGEA